MVQSLESIALVMPAMICF